jgi:hypothetical protein
MKVNRWNRFLFAPAEDTPSGGAVASATVPKSAAQKDAQHAIANFDPGPMPDISGILDGSVDPSAQKSDPPATPVAEPASATPKVDPPSGEPAADDADPFAPIEDIGSPKSDDDPKPGETPKPAEGEPAPTADSKGLRAQLELANQRIKEYESGQASEEIRKQLLEVQEANKRLQGQIHARDPHSHPEVIDLRREMQGKYAGVVRSMQISGEDPSFLVGFLQSNLPDLTAIGDPNSQAYLDKVGELRSSLQERGISRESIGAILNLADQGVDNSKRMASKIKDISDNWTTYEAKSAREEHERIAKEWSSIERTWLNPTPDKLENDPYNPTVFMAKAIQGNDQLESKLRQTGKALVSTFMPLPPIMPEDLAGMDDNEVSNYLENRVKTHSTKLRAFHGVVGDAMMFYRMGPSILRRLAEAESALADYKGADPVPGGGSQPSGPKPQGGPAPADDIKGYEPGPLPSI